MSCTILFLESYSGKKMKLYFETLELVVLLETRLMDRFDFERVKLLERIQTLFKDVSVIYVVAAYRGST